MLTGVTAGIGGQPLGHHGDDEHRDRSCVRYQFELWDGGVLRLELAYVVGAPFVRFEGGVERALQEPIQGFEIGILLAAW